MSDVHLSHYEFRCCSGDGLPSGEEQYFSQFGDRHASVFMQANEHFFYIFHRGVPGSMQCYKVCLIFADPDTVNSPLSDNEHAVWVVEGKPVEDIMATITIIVITTAYEECTQ